MRRVFLSLSILFFTPNFAAEIPSPSSSSIEETDESGIVLFNPPIGWALADQKILPPSVKLMVVGKGSATFPPSMNLSTQPYNGTLKQYLKLIKTINDSQGYEWKDLGTIKTEAGNASLSQVDTKNEWGEIRQMHVVLLKNKQIYILTGAALREEYSQFYKVFFESFRSLRVDKNVFEMIKKPQQRAKLQTTVEQLNAQWVILVNKQKQRHPEIPLEIINTQVFEDPIFQVEYWKPFEKLIDVEFKDMGKNWQEFVLSKIQNDLFIKD